MLSPLLVHDGRRFAEHTKTALVRFGAATAIAIAINANLMAYSTTVTPFVLFFLCIEHQDTSGANRGGPKVGEVATGLKQKVGSEPCLYAKNR